MQKAQARRVNCAGKRKCSHLQGVHYERFHSMCVCMYVCMYVYVRTHRRMYVCMHARMYVCTQSCINVCMHV